MCVRLYTVIYIQLIWLAIFDNFTSMHKQLRTFQISIHGVPIKQNILKIFSNPNPPHHLACPGVGFPFPWRHLLHWGGCVRVSASLPSHPLHTSTTPHINHSQILPPPQPYLNHSPKHSSILPPLQTQPTSTSTHFNHNLHQPLPNLTSTSTIPQALLNLTSFSNTPYLNPNSAATMLPIQLHPLKPLPAHSCNIKTS